MFLIPTLKKKKKKQNTAPNVHTEKQHSFVPFSTMTSKVPSLMGIQCVGRPSVQLPFLKVFTAINI